jgi:hypothetical protein
VERLLALCYTEILLGPHLGQNRKLKCRISSQRSGYDFLRGTKSRLAFSLLESPTNSQSSSTYLKTYVSPINISGTYFYLRRINVHKQAVFISHEISIAINLWTRLRGFDCFKILCQYSKRRSLRRQHFKLQFQPISGSQIKSTRFFT